MNVTRISELSIKLSFIGNIFPLCVLLNHSRSYNNYVVLDYCKTDRRTKKVNELQMVLHVHFFVQFIKLNPNIN